VAIEKKFVRVGRLLESLDSKRRTTTRHFVGKTLVAETSYQMLEILSFSDRERTQTSFNRNKRAKFCGQKEYNEAFRGVMLREYAKKIKVIYRPLPSRPRI